MKLFPFQFRYTGIILFWIILTTVIISWAVYEGIIWLLPQYFASSNFKEGSGIILAKINKILLYRVIILLIVAIIGGLLISHNIARPLSHIEKGLEKVSNGDLRWKARLKRGDELESLAHAVNKTVEGLRKIVGEDREVIKEISALLDQPMHNIESGVVSAKDIRKIGESLKIIRERLQNLTAYYKI